MNKRIFSLLLATVVALTSFSGIVSASNSEEEESEVVPVQEIVSESKEVCGFDVPEEKTYGADVISVRKKMRVEPGEVFRVKVFLKNTGSMPWFSGDSNCLGPKMFLGTDRDRDRNSVLYSPKIESVENPNWVSNNRIGMDQLRVEPGEIASFTFWSIAPSEPDVLKEYFTPLLNGIQWIDDAEFSFELMVGDSEENPADLRMKMFFAATSGSIADFNLNGEKEILVDLSDQLMSLKLDGRVVRAFPVSTGKSSTPTPIGTTYISLKQNVRVGGKAPHYVMPKFMMFRAGGYGIHALPSLAGDGGWFWTEARSHIGIPVSHGCIRLLPEDADFAYRFTDVGTKVVVKW